MLKKTKLLYSIFAFISIGVFGQDQDTPYSIIDIGTSYSQTDIENALNDANLCGFFYINEKRKMLFDDGTIVELKSSEELNDLDQGCFIPKSPAHKDEFWKIASNGHLLRIKQAYAK